MLTKKRRAALASTNHAAHRHCSDALGKAKAVEWCDAEAMTCGSVKTDSIDSALLVRSWRHATQPK